MDASGCGKTKGLANARPFVFLLNVFGMFLEGFLAERVGFEPTVLVKVHTLSKRAP